MAFSAAGPPSYAGMGGHTRVSYKRAPNFLERVGGSLCGSVIGLFLIAGACILLFLNEVGARALSLHERPSTSVGVQGRSVHTYNMLVETRNLCKPIKSPDSVFSALDHKLVYLSGKLATSGPVSDNDFGVSGEQVQPLLLHAFFTPFG